MKLSKILFGVVAAAAVMGFVSCGDGIIGGGKKYTINYTNDSDDIYRKYNDTALKHAGGLVKVTFKGGDEGCKNTSNHDYGTGMMGTIFGFEDSVDENAPAGAHDFYIMSISENGNYYVSKFVNIKDDDLEKSNFGATTVSTINTTSGEPQEKVYVTLNSTNQTTLLTDGDDKIIYLYERALIDGSYDYAILKLTEEQVEEFAIEDYKTSGSYIGTKVIQGNIPNAFTAVDSESKLTQKKLAVYANVYPKNTLVGEWYYMDTYKEAEVIE